MHDELHHQPHKLGVGQRIPDTLIDRQQVEYDDGWKPATAMQQLNKLGNEPRLLDPSPRQWIETEILVDSQRQLHEHLIIAAEEPHQLLDNVQFYLRHSSTYHLVLVLAEDAHLPQKQQRDDQQVKVIPLQHSNQQLDDASLLHLLFDGRVLAQVHQNVQRHEKQLVLLTDQQVQLSQLDVRLGIGLPARRLPQLDVLAVADVEPIDLALQHIHAALSHLMFD